MKSSSPVGSADAAAELLSQNEPGHLEVNLTGLLSRGTRVLPWIERIFVENLVRHAGQNPASVKLAERWVNGQMEGMEFPFFPERIFMHDTTCVPALVDIAALRDSIASEGGDPTRLNPVLPINVSVDHSVAVDAFGTPDALATNMAKEFERNSERYTLIKWASQAFDNFVVHPPGSGIMHTINMERVATVVSKSTRNGADWIFPDTLIGTDSHTPMVNGLGVLAWGVGGLEAESVMFGAPVIMRKPNVVGVRLTRSMPAGVNATDLALLVTDRLRRVDLAGRFVEFFGPGVSTLSAGERAVVANMTPEFGGATGYFPVDDQTLAYLAITGRTAEQIELVRSYTRRAGLWFDPAAKPDYAEVIELDLSEVRTCLAGPRRPQDRVTLDELGASLPPSPKSDLLPHGAIAIAAITSCTNTTDPRQLLAAGLLAKKARALGLSSKPWVKTSLAPGSPAARAYLERAGLLADLEALGFAIVGYGCTTCIGNSGALLPAVTTAMETDHISPVAVISGNRNFPGRIHPSLDAGYLTSPSLVVAFALAGDVSRNMLLDPIGEAPSGQPVFLSDVWPSEAEIDVAVMNVDGSDIAESSARLMRESEWNDLEAPSGPLFPWDENSTYLRAPRFITDRPEPGLGNFKATPLLVLGDDITTDHISPAGAISPISKAADYLIGAGADRTDLNVYASRRGNWEVMLRGLFTNKSVRNLLAPEIPAGSTVHATSGAILPLYEASQLYRNTGTPLVIIAGERYGMGSSRDWAAKGAALLGVRAILASSFERIHRSNLVNMGILPLKLPRDLDPLQLAIKPSDQIQISAAPEQLRPRSAIDVRILRKSGKDMAFQAIADVETDMEVEVLRAGGMLMRLLNAPA